jgi:hypothetical protein
MTIQISKEMRNQESFTSIGKGKFDEIENGHEFELSTITEKSTRRN